MRYALWLFLIPFALLAGVFVRLGEMCYDFFDWWANDLKGDDDE